MLPCCSSVGKTSLCDLAVPAPCAPATRGGCSISQIIQFSPGSQHRVPIFIDDFLPNPRMPCSSPHLAWPFPSIDSVDQPLLEVPCPRTTRSGYLSTALAPHPLTPGQILSHLPYTSALRCPQGWAFGCLLTPVVISVAPSHPFTIQNTILVLLPFRFLAVAQILPDCTFKSQLLVLGPCLGV